MAEASNLAFKKKLKEKSLQNFWSFKYFSHNNLISACDKENSVTTRDFNPENNGTSNLSGVQQGNVLSLEWKRSQIKYLSNKESRCCYGRKWRWIGNEGHSVENDEYAGVEFAEEESYERVNFVLQWISLASKDEGHHKNLFKAHYFIKNNVCNMIVESVSTKNLVLHKLVGYLKLSTEHHKKLYTLSWVSKGSQIGRLFEVVYRTP